MCIRASSVPSLVCGRYCTSARSVPIKRPTPAVFPAPAPVVDFIAPAPAVSESPAPVVEHLSLAPARFSRSVLRPPQVAEQLVVDLDLKAGWEARVVSGGYTAHPVDPPGGDHRQPRAVDKYWARMRIFYEPLYLAVTCSVLVCLRSTWVDFFLGDDFWSSFRDQRFLVRKSGSCFFQFTEAFVLGSCDRFSSCSLYYRIQRTAWSSARQSTEW